MKWLKRLLGFGRCFKPLRVEAIQVNGKRLEEGWSGTISARSIVVIHDKLINIVTL